MFAIVACGLDRWLSVVVILVIVGPATGEVEEGAARGAR
jgi:hypothetical protein